MPLLVFPLRCLVLGGSSRGAFRDTRGLHWRWPNRSRFEEARAQRRVLGQVPNPDPQIEPSLNELTCGFEIRWITPIAISIQPRHCEVCCHGNGCFANRSPRVLVAFVTPPVLSFLGSFFCTRRSSVSYPLEDASNVTLFSIAMGKDECRAASKVRRFKRRVGHTERNRISANDHCRGDTGQNMAEESRGTFEELPAGARHEVDPDSVPRQGRVLYKWLVFSVQSPFRSRDTNFEFAHTSGESTSKLPAAHLPIRSKLRKHGWSIDEREGVGAGAIENRLHQR